MPTPLVSNIYLSKALPLRPLQFAFTAEMFSLLGYFAVFLWKILFSFILFSTGNIGFRYIS